MFKELFEFLIFDMCRNWSVSIITFCFSLVEREGKEVNHPSLLVLIEVS